MLLARVTNLAWFYFQLFLCYICSLNSSSAFFLFSAIHDTHKFLNFHSVAFGAPTRSNFFFLFSLLSYCFIGKREDVGRWWTREMAHQPRNESKKSFFFLVDSRVWLVVACLFLSPVFYFIMWRGETQDGEAENEREWNEKKKELFFFQFFFSSPFFARLLSSFSNSLRFVLLLGFTHSSEMISNSSTKYLQKFVLIKRESQKSTEDKTGRGRRSAKQPEICCWLFPSVVALSSFTCPVPVTCISLCLYDQAEMETDARGWGHNGELFFTLSAWRKKLALKLYLLLLVGSRCALLFLGEKRTRCGEKEETAVERRGEEIRNYGIASGCEHDETLSNPPVYDVVVVSLFRVCECFLFSLIYYL